MTTVVYKYGLLAPTENAELVMDQIRKSHKYYNTLTEIERYRHQNSRQASLKLFPEIQALADEKDRIAAQYNEASKALRARRRAERTQEQKDLVADLAGQLATAKRLFGEAKAAKRSSKELQKIWNDLNEKAKNDSREARANSECYWGNYLKEEQASAAAKSAIIELAKTLAMLPPQERAIRLARNKTLEEGPSFRRWNGRGSVAAQIQHGIAPEELFGCQDTRVRIAPLPDDVWNKNRSTNKRTMLHMRVGSTEKLEPIFASWPLILHRPIPPEAQIMWARVMRESLGGKDRWSLHLSLRLPDEWKKEPCGSGRVAMDIGWRKLGEGNLRVCFLRDDNGQVFEIRLDPSVVRDFRQVEHLESIRSQNLNTMLESFRGWLDGVDTPQWFKEETETMALWKAKKRFARLAIKWRTNRWDGDEIGYTLLEEWRKQDTHLWTWSVNLRDQAKGRRLNYYRNLAASLARTYGEIVLEDKFLAETQKHDPDEQVAPEIKEARWNQRTANCYRLKECITQAFTMRGGRVIRYDPDMTTQECNLCGCTEPWDPAVSVTHRCAGCHEEWDQDSNAAANLLKWSYERPDGIVPEKPKRQAKWARLGRHQKGARNKSPEAAQSLE